VGHHSKKGKKNNRLKDKSVKRNIWTKGEERNKNNNRERKEDKGVSWDLGKRGGEKDRGW